MSGSRYVLLLAPIRHLVRIGPNDLVTDDPDALRRINAVRGNYQKSHWYDAMRFQPKRDNVLSLRDGKSHQSLRSKMSAGYSGREVPHLEEKVDTRLQELMDFIDTRSSDSRPFDFATLMQYYALDIITDIAFGAPFGYVKRDEDVHGFCKSVRDSIKFLVVLGTLPSLLYTMRFLNLDGLLSPSPKDETGLGKLMAVAKDIVGERFGAEKVDKKDMLGSFIRHGVSQEDAEGQIVLQMMAGSDTTATALRTIFFSIITSPQTYVRLQNEIDATQSGSSRPFHIIRESEAQKLPYLQACIKEGMRMWPPLTGLQSKTVPTGGDEILGFHVPAGTNIGWSIWSMQRNSGIFGQDADVFRPERWLQENPDRLQQMTKTQQLIFGSGMSVCLGKSVAYMEISKTLFELFRRYDFSISDVSKPMESINAGLFLQRNLNVSAKIR
ncbi:MAG: hypothetical protein M1825_003924 [Sarcosagium campestre]|nr:MAG: hypothetical protein M1825_003924 [Sarcosagium campestre]